MIKKLRILHSNDIHADFCGDADEIAQNVVALEEAIDSNRVENTLYLIAGDAMTGSITDQETKGVSTIQAINYLQPDVMCLGNHEFDYGASWMLLLEKMAQFPIVCSNVYIKGTDKRLFSPYKIIYKNDVKILIIGLAYQIKKY